MNKYSLILVLLLTVLVFTVVSFNISTVKSSPDYGHTEQKYYLREALPTHSQESGASDTGHLNHSAPTTDEDRSCSIWVQYYLDEDDALKDWVISKIHWHIYWTSSNAGDCYAGWECNGTHANSMDYSKKIGEWNPGGSLYNETWTDILIQPPNVSNSYFFTLKVTGHSIKVESNSTHTSYVIVTYGPMYTFHGLYDEDSGLLNSPGERAANVTAFYSDEASETFEVNGTYVYNTTFIPLFFHVDLGSANREYWLDSDEAIITIYLFNATLTTYTISFLDLAGVLDTHPFVEAKRYINGSLMTVEKRKVDVENKLVMNLINGQKYSIIIGNGVSYTFGDLLFTDTTTIQLILKGIEFSKETLMTYKFVRIYGLRVFDTPNGTITITYQDTLNLTTSVIIEINYKNGTQAYNHTETSDSFNHEWASARNGTDYALVCTITHDRYGVYVWKNYYPRTFSDMPWGMDWFGTSLPFNTAYIIPTLLILFIGGCFSTINAELGAFLMVVLAIIIAYMGWLPISGAMLIVAFSLALLMALVYSKRMVRT